MAQISKQTSKHAILGVNVATRPHPQRKGIWEARLTQNGKRKSFCASSAELAVARASRYLETIAELEAPLIRTELLGDLGYWFAATLALLYSESPVKNTRDKALWCISIIASHCNGHMISKIDLATVLKIWRIICAAHPKPGTQRTILQFYSRGLRLLHREGQLPYNYAEEISRPVLVKRASIPSTEAAICLWRSCAGHYLAPKVFLEFVLGLSDDEANNVTLDDLGNDSLLVRGTKNANRVRTIYLPQSISVILAQYACGKNRYLVENTCGKRTCSGSTRDMKLRFAKASVAWCGNHGLRHAFTAIETTVGCPPSVRMAIMGQSLRSLIQMVYVHPTPANMRDWLALWANHLGLTSPKCLPKEWGTVGEQVGNNRPTK